MRAALTRRSRSSGRYTFARPMTPNLSYAHMCAHDTYLLVLRRRVGRRHGQPLPEERGGRRRTGGVGGGIGGDPGRLPARSAIDGLGGAARLRVEDEQPAPL